MEHETDRRCELKIPDKLVEKLQQLTGGIQPVLIKLEKEYSLSTSSSYVESNHFSIIGPNPEILDLAIETLERRFTGHDKQDSIDSGVSHELEDKRATWKFLGDYAKKACHLFLPELKELESIESVIVKETKNCLEITCSYDDVNTVKQAVDKLERALHDLYEDTIKVKGKTKELDLIKEYIQKTHARDKTVIMVFNEGDKTVNICGKTKEHIDELSEEFRSGKVTGTLVLPVLVKSKKFKHQLKIPKEIVKKMENQKGGIFPIINSIEKEFGLEVKYVRDRFFILFGPSMSILELMSQTLVLRYVLKIPPTNAIIGMLQRQNVLWKFLGEYARKVNHLFKRELSSIKRMKTVTVRAFPSQMIPIYVEILCSVKAVDRIKPEIEKLVELLNNLYEQKVTIPNKEKATQKLREFVRHKHEHDATVLCILDESDHTLTVWGRNFYIVRQTASEALDVTVSRSSQSVPVPDELKNMYRQMYQTRLNDHVVEKLQNRPGGILPVIQRIEKDYGLKALCHKNKVSLVSPSDEVLELAVETLEDRYATNLIRSPSIIRIKGQKRTY